MCKAPLKAITDTTTCCSLCYEILNSVDYPKFKIKKCNYEIHMECYVEHIHTALKEKNYPIKCPNPDCEEHFLDVNKDAARLGNVSKLARNKELWKKMEED